MKRLTGVFIAVVLSFGLLGTAMAAFDTATQTVTVTVAEIVVIDVTGGPITLAIVAPTLGGDLPADETDSTAYLQYSSNLPAATIGRVIDAAIDVSTLASYDLKLLAGAPTGTGTGTAGLEITLGTGALPIITGITTGNTGIGGSDGSKLTYTATCLSMPAVDPGTDYTVTYTLRDAA